MAKIISIEERRERAEQAFLNNTDFSEQRLANMFVAKFGEDVKYVIEWGEWIVWNGTRWEIDRNQTRMEAMAAEIGRDVRELSLVAEPEGFDFEASKKIKKDWIKFAHHAQSRSGLTAMLYLARHMLPISSSKLDANHAILPLSNGAVFLFHTHFMEPERIHMNTKASPVSYDPDADCPRWMEFLDVVFKGDVELVSSVQRIVGYALTGSVKEQCLFFLHGDGRNGKSTFMQVLTELLGEGQYSQAAPQRFLEEKANASHPTEFADLFGARVMRVDETKSNRKWDEGLVKSITGGDPIKARRMNENFWTFNPTHKIFVTGNYKPLITGTDEGIWRRVKMIPFKAYITDEQVDKDLPAKLHAEMPGILNWALTGCRDWHKKGLMLAKAITVETERYRKEQDSFGEFFNDCLFSEPGAVSTNKEVRDLYDGWCEDNGVQYPLGQKSFNERIEKHGGERGQKRIGGSKHRVWTNIRRRREMDPE